MFTELDYPKLAEIYCDEGGEAFWEDRRGPCQRLGIKIASHLQESLLPKGRSLYIGAGVAELPMLIAETSELKRVVTAHNLRIDEVAILQKVCARLPVVIKSTTALRARGHFDHIWLVSVLNDPECYPETSALSYGRATPLTFNPDAFKKERRMLHQLVDTCLAKLALPGLVTTSVEEIHWITTWCQERDIPFQIENKTYPTAIVGDPLCFIKIGDRKPKSR